jgi:hypothetical protein
MWVKPQHNATVTIRIMAITEIAEFLLNDRILWHFTVTAKVLPNNFVIVPTNNGCPKKTNENFGTFSFCGQTTAYPQVRCVVPRHKAQ